MALAKENIPEKDINVLTGRETLLFPLFFPLNQSTEDIDPHNNYSINRWTQHDPLSSMAWLQGASGLSVTNLNDLGDPRGHGSPVACETQHIYPPIPFRSCAEPVKSQRGWYFLGYIVNECRVRYCGFFKVMSWDPEPVSSPTVWQSNPATQRSIYLSIGTSPRGGF